MNKKNMVLLIVLSVAFLTISWAGLNMGIKYIDRSLVNSGKSVAMDLALLVKNNFEITDEEVDYMKSLTFNEMEVDAINQRLMDVGNGVKLNADVQNVYIVTYLKQDEYQYCRDKEDAEFLGVKTTQPLDGMWLLNGKINDDGVFEVAERDDIYRYTVLTKDQKQGMKNKEAYGEFSSDAWGNFITGYAPVYTVEGNFVGLLGIDMNPDPYQEGAKKMIQLIIVLFAFTVLVFFTLFIIFYVRYSKSKENQRKFKFFSEMSHEMRTPMNGILGMTAVLKYENDVSVLHSNLEKIETSGRNMLELINTTLNYDDRDESKNGVAEARTEIKVSELMERFSGLKEKKILICEDVPINAKITRVMLEKVGCTVDIAEDGSEGLRLFGNSREWYYDAIIMDIRMPVMDGIEATREIRKLNRKDAAIIPIIALTANSYEEDIKATSDAGMNAHLTKPVEPHILYETLFYGIMNNNRGIED